MKILLLSTIAIQAFSVSPYVILPPHIPIFGNNFSQDCINFGIDVDDGWDIVSNGMNPLTFKNHIQKRYFEADESQQIYQTETYQAILRYEDTNNYAYLCRILLDPVYDREITPVVGRFETCAFNRVSLSIDFDTSKYIMGEWSPTNIPDTATGSVGISVGTSGVSISATMTVESGLETNVSVSTTLGHFGVEYVYNNIDNYSENANVFYAMVKFVSIDEFEIDDFPVITFDTTYNVTRVDTGNLTPYSDSFDTYVYYSDVDFEFPFV